MHTRKFAWVQINAQNKNKKYQDKRCQGQINLPIGTSDSIEGVQAKKKEEEEEEEENLKTRVSHKNSNSCMTLTPGGQLLKLKKYI